VFLTGCGLPERFLENHDFVVGELGFGSGLNIAALLDLWRRERPPGHRLRICQLVPAPDLIDEFEARRHERSHGGRALVIPARTTATGPEQVLLDGPHVRARERVCAAPALRGLVRRADHYRHRAPPRRRRRRESRPPPLRGNALASWDAAPRSAQLRLRRAAVTRRGDGAMRAPARCRREPRRARWWRARA